MIVIHCIRSRGRREYGWQWLVDVCILWEEELVIFAFGLIGKVVDGASRSVAGKDGVYLSLCCLDGYGLVGDYYYYYRRIYFFDFQWQGCPWRGTTQMNCSGGGRQ